MHHLSPRIALYSHDTMGLGHVRRNQLIARALVSKLGANVLLITGIKEAGAFPVPYGIDCLTLPAYSKSDQGHYAARSLDMSQSELKELRAELIDAAIRSFAPDLFIVDNVPRGALGELEPALNRIKREAKTRCVLGLRDILDEPFIVRREWRVHKNVEAIRAWFDTIWIYGDSAVYDTLSEYAFPHDVKAKAHFAGYLDPQFGIEAAPSRQDRYFLCAAGGGQDGFALADAFSKAVFPGGTAGIIVTGPFMPDEGRAALAARAAQRPELAVVEAVYDPLPLMRHARAIVAMAGYNTTTEILSLGKRALLVPRVRPRIEQLIRAERLATMGLVDCLPMNALSPEAITSWLGNDRPPHLAPPDFAGLDRIAQYARNLIQNAQPQREHMTIAVQ
jgi:predicted glycosyltransferase